MRHESIDRVQPSRTPEPPAARTPLVPLSAEPPCTVAAGEPDIRGWRVRTRAGSEMGEVSDLLVDPQSLKVRYVAVRLYDVYVARGEHHVLVPIGVARLDHARDDMYVDTGAGSLLNASPYRPDRLDREFERRTLRNYGWRDPVPPGVEAPEDFYRGPYFDERPFFAGRRLRAGAGYLMPRDDARASA